MLHINSKLILSTELTPLTGLNLVLTKLPVIALLVTVCSLFFSPASFALSSDQDEPMMVESDSADRDEQKGLTNYRGNAVFTQGTMKITGSIISIFHPDNEITKAVAKRSKKKQATFKQKSNNGNIIRAWADRMEYFPKLGKKDEVIHLYGNAVAKQEGRELQGPHLVYYPAKDLVQAEGTPAGKTDKKGKPAKKGRVKTILPSRKKSRKKSK